MQERFRGPRGFTGEQGPPGLPSNKCCHDHLPKPITTRWVTMGGRLSLSPMSCTVIINSEDPVRFTLPEIEQEPDDSQDYYYNAISITIRVQKGIHSVRAKNGNINSILETVDLEEFCTYSFVSTPDGWNLMIFKSQVN